MTMASGCYFANIDAVLQGLKKKGVLLVTRLYLDNDSNPTGFF